MPATAALVCTGLAEAGEIGPRSFGAARPREADRGRRPSAEAGILLASALILAALFGYLSGSCPTAAPISRRLYGSDVRGRGSGNAGAANMFRTFGWKPALAVFVLDVAKGYVPAFLAPGLAVGGSVAPPSTLGLAAGAAAVLGHCYPLFARFRGGKGVATGAGAFLAVHPGAVAVGFGVFAALLALTRYVSAASVAAAAAMPAALLVFGGFGYAAPPADLWLAAALAAFIAFTHRSNLSRLSRGVEPRVGAAGGGPAADADGTTTGGRT